MRYFALFLLLTIGVPAAAQDWGYNLNVGLRKTFKLSKKSTLDLRQQLQVNPVIKKYNNKFGDFFNEEGFWPVPDRYRDDDELDDDDEDDLPPGAGNGQPDEEDELSDTPRRIKFEWRSTSALQFNHQFFKWLRANTGYGLFYNGEEFRNNFRVEADYRPLRHFKGKRKLDLAARTLFQYQSNPDDGEIEWNAALVPRADVIWNFKKNHALTLSNALNGAWDDGIFEFDRWRANLNLTFTYDKINRFTLGYQFQQRLDKPDHSHGLSLNYELRF
ncbi:MAG: hypothetical protein SFV22_09400 [Saprospiraceae bacterium]|nr:hypothetical protein [Saprospiraceae bacterium]